MAYSLRLPAAIDAAARAKADYLGISLNALVCVALDAYLRSPGEPGAAGSGSAAEPAKPSKTSPAGPEPEPKPDPEPEPPKLTRAEKQAIYEREKQERRALFRPR